MIVEIAELKELREKHKGKKIALTGGAFDILHPGHIVYLEEVKNMADVLVVAITDDKRVKGVKGPDRPINDEITRAVVVDAIRYVDYVCIDPGRKDIENEWAHIEITKELLPDIFVTIHSRYKKYEEQLQKQGIELIILSPEEIGSTTAIIEKIKK